MNKNEIIMGETFNFLKGYRDKDGLLHEDFELREMNGTDEEAISRNEVKANGGKVVRTLLTRCCIRIGSLYQKDFKPNDWIGIIQSIDVGDQDIMLMKLREITLGAELEAKYQCPNADCKEDIRVTINTDELEIDKYNGVDLIPFELPKGIRNKEGQLLKVGKLRRPIGEDREVLDSIMRKNVGLANTMMLSRCIMELEGNKVYDDLIRQLSLKDRNYLLELIKENNYGINLSVEVDCPSCGESFTASLNAVNFI